MKYRNLFGMLAIGLIATLFILSPADAHAAFGGIEPAAAYGLGTLITAGASGGIARLAACTIGPRIFFDRPNEGGGVDAIVREFKGLHTDVKAALEEAGVKTGEIAARMDHLEQKLARGGSGGQPPAPKSLGEVFIEQENVKEFARRSGKNDRTHFEVKATLTSSTANAAGSVGAALDPYRDPNIVRMPRRRPIIRDLLPVVQMDGGSVEFVVQTGWNNNAEMVAEGARKPESDFKFELRQAPARVIAHYTKASRQVLSDIPQLSNLINSELLEGLAIREEYQILHGDGTGQNLLGIALTATAYDAPIAVNNPTSLDVIGMALAQTALAYHPADGIIMNPVDWAFITTMKDTTGNYLFGPPGTAVEPRLFSVPVIITPAIAVDKFMVGNFQHAATLYDRWEARVEVGYESDDFTKNLMTILAEERVALAVKDASALVYGDFGRVA